MMKAFSKKINMAKVFVVSLIASMFLLETLTAETRYRVKSSDNLNSIVERFYKNSDLSKGQLLIGVLAENPRAFKGGNINFLLRGQRLVLPDESDLQQTSPDNASEILSEHARFFRFGITGNLPPPISSELISGSAELVNEKTVSNEILTKQKTQNKKIDQLQQESDELKKQLEALVNEKSNRDQRLIELEESLKQTLATAKQANPIVDSAKKQALEESNKQLQRQLNVTKSELAENSKSNTALERKVESLREVLDDKNSLDEKTEKRTIESSASILSNMAWLIPLLLFTGLLVYLFAKKKKSKVAQFDDKIEVSESGYIEPFDERTSKLELEVEEPLDTSVKLDVARAYIEAEDTQSALDILSEIMEEGSDEQRKVAHELLERISPS